MRTQIKLQKGDKIKYIKTGILGFEEIDEPTQAGLLLGEIYTVEEYDAKDNAIVVVEALSSIWISAEHFKLYSN